MVSSRFELNTWRVIAIVSVLLIALVAVRGATRNPGGSTTTDGGGVQTARGKYTCQGPTTTSHGTCADNWWEAIWHGISYCDDLETACKAGGGTWTRKDF
jgi:hypothetical protein